MGFIASITKSLRCIQATKISETIYSHIKLIKLYFIFKMRIFAPIVFENNMHKFINKSRK